MEDIFEVVGDSGSFGSLPLAIAALVLALAATVLAFIFIIPEKKRAGMKPFLRFLHDIFNFKHLLIEKILQVLYVFTTAFVILTGFFQLFDFQTYYGMTQWGGGRGLLIMIVGPIVVRLAYEGMMLIVLLVKNVISINQKLSNGAHADPFSSPDLAKVKEELKQNTEKKAEPVQPIQPVRPEPVQPAPAPQKPEPVRPVQPVQSVQPVQPAAQPKKRFCTQCGARLDESGVCPNCGK